MATFGHIERSPYINHQNSEISKFEMKYTDLMMNVWRLFDMPKSRRVS